MVTSNEPCDEMPLESTGIRHATVTGPASWLKPNGKPLAERAHRRTAATATRSGRRAGRRERRGRAGPLDLLPRRGVGDTNSDEDRDEDGPDPTWTSVTPAARACVVAVRVTIILLAHRRTAAPSARGRALCGWVIHGNGVACSAQLHPRQSATVHLVEAVGLGVLHRLGPSSGQLLSATSSVTPKGETQLQLRRGQVVRRRLGEWYRRLRSLDPESRAAGDGCTVFSTRTHAPDGRAGATRRHR